MGKINKAEAVKNYIYEEIRQGRIKNGQRLPSCRDVSSLLSVNKITVNKAYNDLEREHRAYSIPRGGFYLVDTENKTKTVLEEVDFYTIKPDEKLIPYREFTHVINKAVEMYKNNLFYNESPIGLASLRDTLKSIFERDAVYAKSDNIVITNGAQQALSLAMQVIFHNNDKKLLVEVPTYNLVVNKAEQLGIDLIGIERKIDGYNFDELEQLFQTGNIGAFYVIPRHHNPTGYNLSEGDKQRIAQLSEKYDVLIIEDDYLGDLGSRKGAMPIHYYDTNKRTIYVRSFSKTFMPGIRLGAAVMPSSIIDEVARFKYVDDLNTSRLLQASLELFIKSGMYERQARRVRKSYEAKLNRVREIIKAIDPVNQYIHVPEHGIFLWLKLPEYIKSSEFIDNLKTRGIIAKTASECFIKSWEWKNNTNLSDRYIRLCISGVKEDQINNIAYIVGEIKKLSFS